MYIEKYRIDAVCCCSEAVYDWEQSGTIKRDAFIDRDSAIAQSVLGAIELIKTNIIGIAARLHWLDERIDTRYLETINSDEYVPTIRMMGH